MGGHLRFRAHPRGWSREQEGGREECSMGRSPNQAWTRNLATMSRKLWSFGVKNTGERKLSRRYVEDQQGYGADQREMQD